MPNKLFRKVLVVGIIILFISVSIQPALSSEVSNKENQNADTSTKGDLVDNVEIRWLGTVAFSEIFLAFLGLPVYFTQAKMINNNDVGYYCQANITLSTGDGTVLDEWLYKPPFKHESQAVNTLLIYTLHEWQRYGYLWGHFDITIDYHILDDGSNVKKVFHGFIYRYGTFIYNKDGKVIE